MILMMVDDGKGRRQGTFDRINGIKKIGERRGTGNFDNDFNDG